MALTKACVTIYRDDPDAWTQEFDAVRKIIHEYQWHVPDTAALEGHYTWWFAIHRDYVSEFTAKIHRVFDYDNTRWSVGITGVTNG